MPVTQFNRPVLLGNGELYVSGPFDAEGVQLLGDVTVRFVIVQHPSPYAAADPQTAAPIKVEGVGSWSAGGDWKGTIPADRVPYALRASPQQRSPGMEGLCRGVGCALWLRELPDERLPVFESLTWCATTEVVVEGVGNVPYDEYRDPAGS